MTSGNCLEGVVLATIGSAHIDVSPLLLTLDDVGTMLASFTAAEVEMSSTLTRHAEQRLRQRGYRTDDVELVLDLGTPTGNAVLLTNQDVETEIAECRHRIARLERLRGTAIILGEEKVVSVYKPRRIKARRMLRSRNGRGLGVPRHRDSLGFANEAA